MGRSVVLIGSYPPPYGGCSVHVERLRAALGVDFDMAVVDFYGRPDAADAAGVLRYGPLGIRNVLRALGAIRQFEPRLAHVHVSALDGFLLGGHVMLAILPRGTSRMLTIHSGSFVRRFATRGSWRRFALLHLLRRFEKIIAVSEEQRAFLVELGVSRAKIEVIAAFLPPIATETARARQVLASLGPYERLVISSGYGLPFYGFETVVDAVDRLSNSGKRTGVILCTYNTFDEPHLAGLASRRAGASRVVIERDLSPGEFAWLLERGDVYVRATDRDGDAVAVREAVYFGTRVIASDCVVRPAGVTLFRTGDTASLARALEDVFASARPVDATRRGADGLAALRTVYETICA